MADPAGATNYITITSDNTKLAASMPDVGNTFAADLVIDQALAINYEGGAATFIDGLLAGCTDLRVYNSDASIEVPFGIKQFSQVAGSRKLILGLGIPSTAPLLSSAPVTYRLYRGCTGGSFEVKSSVVPVADGFAGYWPADDVSGNLTDWTANANHAVPTGTPTYGASGQVGNAASVDGTVVWTPAPNASLGLDAAIDVSAWCNLSGSGERAIIGRWYAGFNWNLDVYQNRVIFQVGTAGYPFVWGNTSLANGVWNHIRGTWDGANLNVYINGIADATPVAASGILPSYNQIYIGSYKPAGSQYIGVLDEVQLSSIVRSANWRTSEQNMASANDTFWTIGPEQSCGRIWVPSRRRGDPLAGR